MGLTAVDNPKISASVAGAFDDRLPSFIEPIGQFVDRGTQNQK